MIPKPKPVADPLLARELCVAVRALVGSSGNCVLLQALHSRLGVEWDQLDDAVALAKRMGWIEDRGAGSVGLLPTGMEPVAAPLGSPSVLAFPDQSKKHPSHTN